MIINCRKIARKIRNGLKGEIAERRAKGQIFGGIACVEWCGFDMDFSVLLGIAANEIGVNFSSVSLVEGATAGVACSVIYKLAEDDNCGGIVVSRQMPEYVYYPRVFMAIPLGKDIDCAHHENRAAINDIPSRPFMPPAIGAARSVFLELRLGNKEIQRKRVVLIGKGPSICQPIYLWLLGRTASLDIIDTKTEPDEKTMLLRQADVVICGAAADKVLVTGEMIRPDTVVLDFGAPTPNADAASIHAAGGFVTQNPGGMGPLVIAHLLKNYVILNTKD